MEDGITELNISFDLNMSYHFTVGILIGSKQAIQGTILNVEIMEPKCEENYRRETGIVIKTSPPHFFVEESECKNPCLRSAMVLHPRGGRKLGSVDWSLLADSSW